MKNKDWVIFLDLDNTVLAFNQHFKQVFGEDIAILEKRIGRQKLNNLIDSKKSKFWSEIPWLAEGKELYNYCVSNFEKVFILSSPGSFKYAIQGKEIFLERELSGHYLALFEKDKYKYAANSHILIDDYDKNLKKWSDAGGIPIKFESTKQVIERLEEILKNEV